MNYNDMLFILYFHLLLYTPKTFKSFPHHCWKCHISIHLLQFVGSETLCGFKAAPRGLKFTLNEALRPSSPRAPQNKPHCQCPVAVTEGVALEEAKTTPAKESTTGRGIWVLIESNKTPDDGLIRICVLTVNYSVASLKLSSGSLLKCYSGNLPFKTHRRRPGRVLQSRSTFCRSRLTCVGALQSGRWSKNMERNTGRSSGSGRDGWIFKEV